MSSIKCNECGLVNFRTDQHCKRCTSSLADGPEPANYSQFYEPPPPPVFHPGEEQTTRSVASPLCIKCGVKSSISMRNFKKDYNSPVALLGIFLGIIPALLLALILRTRHQISAPFCEMCWLRFRHADTYRSLLLLSVVPGIFLVVGLSIYADSITAAILGLVTVLVAYSLASRHIKSVSPKFKRVTSKEVVISAPMQGDLVFSKK